MYSTTHTEFNSIPLWAKTRSFSAPSGLTISEIKIFKRSGHSSQDYTEESMQRALLCTPMQEQGPWPSLSNKQLRPVCSQERNLWWSNLRFCKAGTHNAALPFHSSPNQCSMALSTGIRSKVVLWSDPLAESQNLLSAILTNALWQAGLLGKSWIPTTSLSLFAKLGNKRHFQIFAEFFEIRALRGL